MENASNVLVTMEIQAHIAIAVISDSKVIRSHILGADVSINVWLARLGAFRNTFNGQIHRALGVFALVAELTIGVQRGKAAVVREREGGGVP